MLNWSLLRCKRLNWTRWWMPCLWWNFRIKIWLTSRWSNRMCNFSLKNGPVNPRSHDQTPNWNQWKRVTLSWSPKWKATVKLIQDSKRCAKELIWWSDQKIGYSSKKLWTWTTVKSSGCYSTSSRRTNGRTMLNCQRLDPKWLISCRIDKSWDFKIAWNSPIEPRTIQNGDYSF